MLDDPTIQATKPIFDGVAKGFGVTIDYLIVPNDTTDFAPIAAQVAQRNPDAIAVVVPGVVPLMNALDAEGITPKTKPFFTSTDLIPPDIIQQLGTKLDGFYLISDGTANPYRYNVRPPSFVNLTCLSQIAVGHKLVEGDLKKAGLRQAFPFFDFFGQKIRIDGALVDVE